MKLLSFLSATALLGLGVSLLDLTLNAHLGLYAATASVLILVGVVRDYAPRRAYWQPRRAPLLHFPAASNRLAA